MQLLNLFIIPIILASLFFQIEFAYVISLLCSLAAAAFIYAGQGLLNILFTIFIFNLTPLFCLHLNSIFRQRELSLKAKKETARSLYQRMQKESSIMRQSNSHLSEEVFQASELYKISRDMSAVLYINSAFYILGKKLTELFRFKRCRLILTSENTELTKIEKVLELRYLQPQVNAVDVEPLDFEILKQNSRVPKATFLKAEDLPKDITGSLAFRSLALVPLIAEDRFLGTLAVEDLPFNRLDGFSTLTNQFCLMIKRIKLYEEIQRLAISDGLTGLFVRRYFLERLEEETKRSARHNLQLAFLMLDIDYFKQCNDNFGHLTGDAVLKEVAGIIKANVREIDLVTRFGGEEFSVLLPDTDKEGAGYVAERIRLSIDRQIFKAYDETVKIAVSIGVAAFPIDARTSQGLIDNADQALYRAKQEGRNRISIFGGVA